MSGGQQEASALEEDSKKVQEAAHKLAEALKEAEIGFHGWRISDVDLEQTINDMLHETGWTIQRPRKPIPPRG